jgi:hypothetical protein
VNPQDKYKVPYYDRGSEIGVGLETINKTEFCLLAKLREQELVVLKDKNLRFKNDTTNIEIISRLAACFIQQTQISLFDEGIKVEIEQFLNGLKEKYATKM